MIDTIAKRRTTLNDKTYEKGATVQMPLQQFNDLEPTGRFERAPRPEAAPEPKPEPKAKPTASKSSDPAD